MRHNSEYLKQAREILPLLNLENISSDEYSNEERDCIRTECQSGDACDDIIFQYWKKNFNSSDGISWSYWGHGCCNMVYRSGDLVYKIAQNPFERTDNPDRLVRIWNEINGVDKHQHLEAKIYESGCVFPFIAGEEPSTNEVMEAIIEIYNRTRRVVIDACAPGQENGDTKKFGNFKKMKDGRIVCVDVGAAVRLEEMLSRSEVSLDYWKKEKQFYDDVFLTCSSDVETRNVIILLKAILYVELTNFELKNIELLKEPAVRELLARAYDQNMCDLDADSRIVLSKEEVQRRSLISQSHSPIAQFSFEEKRYSMLNKLFELNINEQDARILARSLNFTPAHFYFLESLEKQKKGSARAAAGFLRGHPGYEIKKINLNRNSLFSHTAVVLVSASEIDKDKIPSLHKKR